MENKEFWVQKSLYGDDKRELIWDFNIPIYDKGNDFLGSKTIELLITKDKTSAWVEGTEVAVNNVKELHDFIVKYIKPISQYDTDRAKEYFSTSWSEIEKNHLLFVDEEEETLYKLNMLEL